MEVKFLYPQLIGYALVVSFIMLLVWRRRKKYKKGVVVANSKYAKRTGYFKYLFIKYHFYNILIKAICILLIVITSILTSRLYKTERHEETKENRDIMLCMDVSASVYDLDAEIIDSFIDIVSNLKEERFGISAFDSSPVTVLPFTTDYNYAISVLKELKTAFNKYGSVETRTFKIVDENGRPITYISKVYTAVKELFAGAFVDNNGASLVGDGLAYCGSTFKKDDGRTKIVIFTTDNEPGGNALISLSDAAGYCKQNDVKVYSIGTKTILPNKRVGMVDVATKTGGKYYDFKDLTTKEIVDDIEKLNKTSIISNVYDTNQDLPERIFPYILFLIPPLFILSWRVRI